jgi:hypothetical protein
MNYNDFEQQMQSKRDEARALGDRYLQEHDPNRVRRPGRLVSFLTALRRLRPDRKPVSSATTGYSQEPDSVA